MKKKCWECKKLLDEMEFYPSSLKHSDYICINCHRKRGKLYRLAHKEKIAEQKREYAKANPQKINKYHREWARKNKGKRKITCHKWYVKKKKEAPEYFSTARARYVDKKVVYVRNYRRQFPEKAASWKHKRRALEMNLGGYFTEKQWKELKSKFNYTCPGCKRKEPEIKLAVDHIISPKQWKKWSKENKLGYQWGNIENIQPLCISCNSKKWQKLPSVGKRVG